tara:strand:+ start:887 stop:1096 length:210 start_codon:yes stop_codon:yes gene_type:complete
MNTQGMSYGEGKGEGRTLQEQRDAIPPMKVNKMNLISDSLKVELKEIINEVLDEKIAMIIKAGAEYESN